MILSKSHNNNIGRIGEKIAKKHLRSKGYKVLEENYKTKFGEIDLIVLKNKKITFVEVKTRRLRPIESPYLSVDWQKQERIRKLALYYIKRKQQDNINLGLDIISIILNEKNRPIEIKHLMDVC